MNPPIGSSRTRAAWTVGLLASATAMAFLAGVQESVRLIQVNRLAGTCGVADGPGCRTLDVLASVAAIHGLDRRSAFLLAATGVLLVAVAVAWLAWQHRAHRLVRDRLGAPGLRFTPGWGIGWWLVPVANLGGPFAAVSEVWRASGGDDGSQEPWRERGVPAVLRWWWAFLLAAVAVAVVTRGQSDPSAATFAEVRTNAALIVLGCAALGVAGILAIAVVRSIERRLEGARPYTEVVASAPRDETREPPHRARVGVTFALAAVAFVSAAVVAATSPFITPIERPDAGGPSSVASFLPPAGWQGYGDSALGFVMSAPPAWHEVHDDSPALLRLEPGGSDASCIVISDLPSAGMPLRDVVSTLLSQIHDPAIYDLRGNVDVRSLAVPAGAAQRLRFTALRSAQERGYIQYVLVDARAGWLIGCDAPAGDVPALEPVFDRMIATFRFAR